MPRLSIPDNSNRAGTQGPTVKDTLDIPQTPASERRPAMNARANAGVNARASQRATPDRVRPAALLEFARAAAAAGRRLEAAEAAARMAVSLTRQEDPAAMAALADVLRFRHRYPEALLWIRRAMEAAPDDPAWGYQRQAIMQAAIRGD